MKAIFPLQITVCIMASNSEYTATLNHIILSAGSAHYCIKLV
jgi:hypothetical protein